MAPAATRLERFGMRYLRTESKSADDTQHVLTVEEQASLRSIQRQAVIRAALAGAVSAAVSGVVSVLAIQSGKSDLVYWLWVGGATSVASVLEIAFLYFDGLRAVREMAAHAGITIDPEREEAELALALCRAAFELPSPPHNSLGVDPHREVTKVTALMLSLLYKAKVGLTSFLLKALIRRAMGRAAMRSALEFIAVPVTAAWNAIVAHWVLEEARLRIIGPSAAHELAGWVKVDESVRTLVVEAMACIIVKAHSVHPNVEALTRQFLSGSFKPGGDGDLRTFVAHLRSVEPTLQRVVLRALSAAAIVDGRLSGREKALLQTAFRATGRVLPLSDLEAIRRHMVKGDGLRLDLLHELDRRFDTEH